MIGERSGAGVSGNGRKEKVGGKDVVEE